jgi:uncharacterized protein (UPF0264 family)
MTRLLVSVRDVDEARVALRAGVHLIDIKEPSRGSLGRADRSVVEEIVATVGKAAPVSMALGELAADVGLAGGAMAAGVSYAKLGLAAMAEDPDWPERWQRAVEPMGGVGVVAVIYADWRAARAPRPDRVLEEACRLGCRAVLIDTFEKSAGNLLSHWPMDELSAFVAEIRRRAMLAVLAGSLDEDAIGRVLSLGPDYIAVRGAACRGGRGGPVDFQRVCRLVGQIFPAR